MSFLLTIHCALFFSFCVFAELHRCGEKIQNHPLRYFCIFLPLAATANYGTWVLQAEWLWVGLLIWISGFFCWFGLRSHLESSILFRLLVLARRGKASSAELLARYHESESFDDRLENLAASGLINPVNGQVSAKAKFLLRLFAVFGGGPHV